MAHQVRMTRERGSLGVAPAFRPEVALPGGELSRRWWVSCSEWMELGVRESQVSCLHRTARWGTGAHSAAGTRRGSHSGVQYRLACVHEDTALSQGGTNRKDSRELAQSPREPRQRCWHRSEWGASCSTGQRRQSAEGSRPAGWRHQLWAKRLPALSVRAQSAIGKVHHSTEQSSKIFLGIQKYHLPSKKISNV